MSDLRTGSAEWVREYLYDKHQRMIRNPEYIRFCDDHNNIFGSRGYVDPEKCKQQDTDAVERIQEQFGLEMVFHYNTQINPDTILDGPLFKDTLAVRLEYQREDDGSEEGFIALNPIWNGQFIKLRIDVSPDRPLKQILSETAEYVNYARTIMTETDDEPSSGPRVHLEKRLKNYEVWDLRTQQIPFKDIASRLRLTEESAKKAFYNAFGLIMGDQFTKKSFLDLVREKLLKKATVSGADPKSWNEFLDHDEIKQSELITQTGTVDYETGTDHCGLTVGMCLNDIDLICKDCADKKCYSSFCEARISRDFSEYPACPKIYEYLTT